MWGASLSVVFIPARCGAEGRVFFVGLWRVVIVGELFRSDQEPERAYPAMTTSKSALSVLIAQLFDRPNLIHEEVLPRLLEAGMQDLIDAEPSGGSLAFPGRA